MTAPDTGDVRGFYAALGIDLPAWAQCEAPLRCFANPDAHSNGDRSPSCSVNLISGAWNCHGCGSAGGAYDAALAAGHTPRSAMNLMSQHGLAEPRQDWRRARRRAPAVVRAAARPARTPLSRPKLTADEADVHAWAEELGADSRLLWRLLRERAWSSRVIRQLELGFDGARVTIPIRNGDGELRGVLRYSAFGPRAPKMRAVVGTRLGLVPHPASEPSRDVLLVEGLPDMVAARSCGLAALAVPGTNAWRPAWAQLLAGRRVTIVMDCDRPGRRAAEEVAASLEAVAASVEIADLSPDREDGYDLTDRIVERRRANARRGRGPLTVGALLAPPPSWRGRRPPSNPHILGPKETA